jgi:sec-independent protein translocase protein TatA
MNTLAFTTPGLTEWMVILVIVLVLFGAKRIPELFRGLGQGMNEFRKAREEFDRELHGGSVDMGAKQPEQTYQPVQPVQTVTHDQPTQPQPVQPVQPPPQSVPAVQAHPPTQPNERAEESGSHK